jgi:hypothetical protein
MEKEKKERDGEKGEDGVRQIDILLLMSSL